MKLLVSESVEPGEGDSQVGRLEEVLHLLAVRVELRRVDLDVWREDPVDDLPLGGGGQAGVSPLADHLTQVMGTT